MNTRIYLTGFMGAGKSTIGRMLSAELKSEFVDLDNEIQRRAGESIETIFAKQGEATFRVMETEALQSLLQDHGVIATGGGCFIHNRQWMLSHGVVIYLKVPFEILASRVGADPSRPLWRHAESLFRQRESDYNNAHITVDGSRSPESVMQEIMQKLASLRTD